MSLIKKFNETGQEIGSEDVPVTPDNLPQFVEQYGDDFVKGYAAAVADFEKRVNKEIIHPKNPRMRNTLHVAGRNIITFWEETLTPLLKSLTPFLPQSKNPDDLTPK